MGSDFSKSKKNKDTSGYGQIYCQTDKSAYFTGETVTGRVYLNLITPYPSNQLYLMLRGREVVHLVIEESETEEVESFGEKSTRTNYYDVLYKEKHDIIKMIVPLYTWSALLPGHYTIPFSFMLPEHLPNSFHQEGNRHLANISYTLQPFLQPLVSHIPKMKCKQPLVVRQPVKNAQEGHARKVTTHFSGCCSDDGYNVLSAQFEKNFYAPGEIAQVIIDLDNTKCSLHNLRMTFTLNQKLHLTAKKRKHNKVITKVTRNITGVQPECASETKLIAMNLPPFTNDDYQQTKTLDLKKLLLKLQDNPNCLNSATKSTLISSEYYLSVTCPMDGCCVSTPTITCPIEIYSPEFEFALVRASENWAPQEINCVNIAFGSEVNINNINNMNVKDMTTNQMPGPAPAQIVIDNQLSDARRQQFGDNHTVQNQRF